MRKKVGRLSAYDINRVFDLGLIAQDGVLCKNRAEFEWRNRRVMRRKRALETARALDYLRHVSEARDVITFKVIGGDSEKGYTLTNYEQHLQNPSARVRLPF